MAFSGEVRLLKKEGMRYETSAYPAPPVIHTRSWTRIVRYLHRFRCRQILPEFSCELSMELFVCISQRSLGIFGGIRDRTLVRNWRGIGIECFGEHEQISLL